MRVNRRVARWGFNVVRRYVVLSELHDAHEIMAGGDDIPLNRSARDFEEGVWHLLECVKNSHDGSISTPLLMFAHCAVLCIGCI